MQMFWQDTTAFLHVLKMTRSDAAYHLFRQVCCCKPWKVPHRQRTQTHSANCSTVTITWRWDEIEIPSHRNRPRWQIDRGTWKAIFCLWESIDFPPLNSSLSVWWLCGWCFIQLLCPRCRSSILQYYVKWKICGIYSILQELRYSVVFSV